MFWGIAIPMAIVSITREYPSQMYDIVFLMVLIWGVRLSGFLLFTKILTSGVDYRYHRMVKGSPSFLMLKQILIQASLQALIALTAFPLLFYPTATNIGLILGVGIYSIGIIGETIADFQLYRFKKTSSGICMTGLWRYSRHPNYFFELLVWLGISFLFIGNKLSIISFIGPVTIFIIMYYITGPYTESCSIERHGKAYQDYQNDTSYFFPKLPKKS